VPIVGSNLGQVRAARPDPQLSRHFDGFSLEELVAAAEQARLLLAQPGWNLLTGLIQAEVATIDRELDSGRPLDSRADYAAKHGRRGGLMAFEQILTALIDRAESRIAEQRAKHEDGAESPSDGS
jgi:hypothetical protein